MKSLTKIALSLGGNIGDVRTAFDSAVTALSEAGLSEIRRSSIYTTTPVDCAPGTPDFLNAALVGNWGGTPEELFILCKKLETMAGRPAKHARNASRTLDLDIILFGNRVIDLPHLTIPHPELQNRFFVLDPLVEIAPEWQCPKTNLTLQELRDKLLQRAK